MSKDKVLNKKDQLKNPTNLEDTFNLKIFSKSKITEIYRKIKLIRETEFKIALERERGNIGGPVHLSIGQEAIPSGISINLKKTDFIFGNHRSHAHVIALGSPINKLFAELLGKKTGLSRGLGGSMHLIDKSVGFMGSVPIVAGTISLAVGAGFAISQKSTNDVSLVFLGDGASEEGCFHESLNLARINNLPVIFIVENNLFSSHMEISLRQPSPNISRFAEANCIPYKLIDGNNVADIFETSRELINNCRDNKGPALIEAITYRWLGHVDWREDIDVGVNRCKATLANWKKKCPLKRLRNSILKENIMSPVNLNNIDESIKLEIENSWEEALAAQYPDEDSLLKNIYN
tara:strand:+ start:2542 stop:3588 length:1047 start_codon:yes stop_codon:yes gene_type:complete